MFGIGSKVLAMIGGGLAAVLAVVLAYTIISKNGEIRGLRKEIHDPKTGWIVRHNAAQRDLTTCRGNNSRLSGALTDQNRSIADMAVKTEQAAQAGKAMLAEARKGNQQTLATAARLGTRQPGPDACKSADELILESLQ